MNKWISKVWLLIAFSIIIGLLYNNYYSNYVKSPFIKTRLLVQFMSYINVLLLFIIARKECSKINGKQLLIKSFLFTTTILCIYGVYQYFAHQYGWPYRGIVYSESKVGFGGYQDSNELIFRVNSLANEPKRLTYFMVISIIILFKYRRNILKKINIFSYLILIGLHSIILWLTYSTSIYISIAVFIAFLLFYVIFINYNKTLFRQLSFFLVIGLSTYFYQKVYFDSLYEVRVDKQLEHEEVRAEVKGQEFILSYPEHFIFGVGPGIYNFALAKEFPGKAGLAGKGKFLIPFNSALITYLYDFGIIGFCIFLIPFIQIFFNTKIASKNEFSIFVIFLYCTAITLNPTPTLFVFIGAFEGVKYLEE